MYKDWVGVITSVNRNIWFLLDGGMGFYVPVNERDGFMRNDPYWGVGMPCPGIRTKMSSAGECAIDYLVMLFIATYIECVLLGILIK